MLARMSDHATPLQPVSIPSVDDAVALHESIGGHLSPESVYGVDPIANYSGLQALKRFQSGLSKYGCNF